MSDNEQPESTHAGHTTYIYNKVTKFHLPKVRLREIYPTLKMKTAVTLTARHRSLQRPRLDQKSPDLVACLD